MLYERSRTYEASCLMGVDSQLLHSVVAKPKTSVGAGNSEGATAARGHVLLIVVRRSRRAGDGHCRADRGVSPLRIPSPNGEAQVAAFETISRELRSWVHHLAERIERCARAAMRFGIRLGGSGQVGGVSQAPPIGATLLQQGESR